MTDWSKLDPRKLDELAASDPISKRVVEELDKIPTIMVMRYIGRLLDTSIFITDMLEVYGAAKKHIVRKATHGVSAMLTPLLRPGLEPTDPAHKFTVKAIESELEKKISNYEPWLLNQGLVMLCTVFDVFLEHVLEEVFRQHPKRLLSSEEARRVDLKSVIELPSTDAVIRSVIQREVRRFGFQDTDKKLRYLEKRAGIPTASIFDWSIFTLDIRERLKGWDGKKLKQIFEDRHAIVHADQVRITNRSDLDQVKNFFEKVVMNVTVTARKELGVWSEFDRLAATNTLYEKYKKESQG